MAVEITGAPQIVGLKEFRRELKAMGPEWPKELRNVHEQIARRVRALSQGRAASMGGVYAKSATAIRGRGNQREAKIEIVPGAGTRMANVAFWGAKRHTGWYANPRYTDSGPQHPPWIGNAWDVGVPGTGPYAINDTIAAHMNDILDQYLKMIDNLARKAFPDVN